jgi:hypothetical protein
MGKYCSSLLDIANASDFNSLFGSKVPMTAAANSEILAASGGYSDWIFVGVEDSRVTADDDWNDTIYAFQGVAPVGTSPTVPEPSTWAMMLVGFAGLGFVGHRARKSVAAAA